MSAIVIGLLVLHVLLAGLLILFILLHRGQGGGLSDMFGGGGGSLGGSAVVERNLDRLTVFAALAFVATNISLVVLW